MFMFHEHISIKKICYIIYSDMTEEIFQFTVIYRYERHAKEAELQAIKGGFFYSENVQLSIPVIC